MIHIATVDTATLRVLLPALQHFFPGARILLDAATVKALR